MSDFKDEIVASKMLRANQIAKIYNVGLSTVWLYAKQGKFKPIKVSRNVTLFRADEVEKFFNTDIKGE